MKKIFYKTKLQTETVYMENGCINVYPCRFEAGADVVMEHDSANMKGRMVTENDGTCRFTPYAQGSGPRYELLWSEPYGCLKMSQHRLVLTVNVPIKSADPLRTMLATAQACCRCDAATRRKINRKKGGRR